MYLYFNLFRLNLYELQIANRFVLYCVHLPLILLCMYVYCIGIYKVILIGLALFDLFGLILLLGIPYL